MTKKDYVKIAGVLHEHMRIHWGDLGAQCLVKAIIEDFVVMLQKDNERFSKAYFEDACIGETL